MTQLAFDLSVSLSARDRGAGLAQDNAGETWNKRASEIALSFFHRAGDDGALFEDVREYATLLGLPAPPSPNAWGAVALTLSRQGFIEKTGVYRQSRAEKSHARAQPVWRIK